MAHMTNYKQFSYKGKKGSRARKGGGTVTAHHVMKKRFAS